MNFDRYKKLSPTAKEYLAYRWGDLDKETTHFTELFLWAIQGVFYLMLGYVVWADVVQQRSSSVESYNAISLVGKNVFALLPAFAWVVIGVTAFSIFCVGVRMYSREKFLKEQVGKKK